MKFCTVINCMDGRVQLPVNTYARKRFNAEYIDTITEAGPNLILAQARNQTAIDAILKRLSISIEKHQSGGVAIVGHHDCAANPSPKKVQIEHVLKSMQWLHQHYPIVEIIGLWVNVKWEIQEIGFIDTMG